MKHSDKFFLALECFLFFSEILKQLTLTFALNGGCYNWWYFPFQLCSLPLYLLPVYLLAKKNSTRQVLLTFFMTYNLLGGIAVFFDTSGLHYPLALLTAHSYLWHILLILLGIYSAYLLLRSTRPSWGLFLQSTLIYGAACLIAEFWNLSLSPFGEINMFYINPLHRMAQVFFCKIADLLGNPAGIVSYILGTVLGAALLFSVWRGMDWQSRARG